MIHNQRLKLYEKTKTENCQDESIDLPCLWGVGWYKGKWPVLLYGWIPER